MLAHQTFDDNTLLKTNPLRTEVKEVAFGLTKRTCHCPSKLLLFSLSVGSRYYCCCCRCSWMYTVFTR